MLRCGTTTGDARLARVLPFSPSPPSSSFLPQDSFTLSCLSIPLSVSRCRKRSSSRLATTDDTRTRTCTKTVQDAYYETESSSSGDCTRVQRHEVSEQINDSSDSPKRARAPCKSATLIKLVEAIQFQSYVSVGTPPVYSLAIVIVTSIRGRFDRGR